MSPPPTWRTRLTAVARHPRVGLAGKAALAATLSWWVALQLPDPASTYAFYAPFGAVATMYPTVVGSFRESVRSLAAITLGALLALAVDAALGPGVLVVGLVVVLGVLLGGLRALGDHRVYVPVVGLFVLVLGQGHELDYAAAYAGLFALGAAVAMGVNALLPSFPLRLVDGALAGLRAGLVSHLLYLAEQLDERLDGDGHGEREDEVERQGVGRPHLAEPTARARDVVDHLLEAARANRRARRHLPAVRAAQDGFRALERVGLLVEDLYDLLEDRPWG
ncbi:hypothetical protein N869_12240, partial [Cellulomonas bogoriensis 69B4 = DSM 16987]